MRIAFMVAVFSATVSTAAIYLPVGSSFQDSVDKYTAGTTYIVKAGLHRLQNVTPKTGDTYIGEPGAVMNGSRLLTQWVAESGYWVHYQQTQAGQVHGDCIDSFPACKYPEDLYKDDVIMKHDTTLAALGAGEYFFDYANDRIYMKDDPAGHAMEICTTRRAFGGSAANVTVKNLTVEKYAIPAQMGAIGDQYPGNAWVIDSCEVKFNHGTGINITNHGVIRNCYVHHNGQKGVGAGGVGCLIENNEISYNQTAGFNVGWEGGGSKFANTDSLVVRNNYVHHNYGPGLWTDINNIHTLYEGNTVDSNTSMGIFHEISFTAVIRCNTVRNNSYGQHAWLYGGQILLSASQNCTVYNNTVVVNAQDGHGLTVISQDRGGTYYARNNYFHNNDVTHKDNTGQNGVATDYDNTNFWATANNLFDYNTYHVPDSTQGRWAWQDAERSWAGFRALGQETHGNVDYRLDSVPAFSSCGQPTGIRNIPFHRAGNLSQGVPALSAFRRNGSLVLTFSLTAPRTIRLAVFDINGRLVAAPVHGMLDAGRHSFELPVHRNGVFVARLSVAGATVVRRMAIIR